MTVISGETEVVLHYARRGRIAPFGTRVWTSLEKAVQLFADLPVSEQPGCRIVPVKQLKVAMLDREVHVDYFDTAACYTLARQLPNA
jgi:hypothetical protein